MRSATATAVTVTVPASPVYAAVPRFTAAMLASTAGFSYDDVERLRTGLDRLWDVLSAAVPSQAPLTLEFELERGVLRVTGHDGCEDPCRPGPEVPRFIHLAATWWATADGPGLDAVPQFRRSRPVTAGAVTTSPEAAKREP